MSDKIYTVDEIRKIVVPIAVKHGVAALYLFGSYARGEAAADSDIDFLMDGGEISDDGYRHGGDQKEPALREGQVYRGAEGADLEHDEEGGDHAVDALRAGKGLKDQHLAEHGRVFGEQAGSRLSDHADALGRAHAAESGGEEGAEDGEVVTAEYG